MRNLLTFAALPLLTCLFVACSGAAGTDAAPPPEGESTLALEATPDTDAADTSSDSDTDAESDGSEAALVDKGRHPARDFGRMRERDRRRHHRWRLHFHHGYGPSPEPEPEPEPAPEPQPEPGPAPSGETCDVAGQTFLDGSSVPSGDSCNTCSCDDGSVSCTEALCEPTLCALFIEAPDGVCSRFPLDPCIAQDPDCTSGGTCEVAGETIPNGAEVPSGDSCNTCECNDGAVICTLALCGPVICAQFIEQSDGDCSRLPLDPCKFQDPDCADAAEPNPPPPFSDPVITRDPLQPSP